MREKDNNLAKHQHVVSVVGQAGIGKTTFFKYLYKNMFGEQTQSVETIYHLVSSQFSQNARLFAKRKTSKNVKENVKKVSTKRHNTKLKLLYIWQKFHAMAYHPQIFPRIFFKSTLVPLIPHASKDVTTHDLFKEKQLIRELKKIGIESKKEISIHSNRFSSLFRMVIVDCYVTVQIILLESSGCFQTVSQAIINLMESAFNGFKDSDTDIILASLYFVNCLSMRDFEATDWNRSHKSKQTLLATSWILNRYNWHLAKCLSFTTELHEDLNEKYATKREILLEFINDQIKGDIHDRFYSECLQHLEDSCYFPLGYSAVCHIPDVTKVLSWPGICFSLQQSQKLLWELHNTDNDGMVYDRAKDPPGQRSVYIPPGDSYQESYRLSTFLRFSDQIPVNPRQLASAGFLYTGYKDRVKCFSCGLCVEDWVIGDDVRSTRWHRSDCEHVRGQDSGNVPIGTGGIARFLIPRGQSTPIGGLPRRPSPPNAMETWPPSAARASTNQSAANSRAPASSHRPHMTARAPHQTSSVNTVEFATISSAYHENFVKNLDLRKESERRRTYEHFLSSSPTVTSHDLARSGFFYLGNLDRVQCFSCGGVLRNWNFGDSVQSEHTRHFPDCRMVQGSETRNIPLTSDERTANTPQPPIFTEPADPPQSEQRDLESMFPCEYPVSAHMRNEDSRLQTFDERWSANNVQATPQQISRAGFFYLGERDRVKCWYCNGGLQNWDPQDEPWTEHAKWFPTCEFLLRRKGPDFVHRMVSMFPNLPRPLLRGPFDVPPAQGGRRIAFGSESARAPTPPPQIIDPQAELRQEEERVDRAMTSEIVKAALDLGFSTRLVRKVVRRRIRRTEMYTSVADLIDDVTIEEREVGSDDEEEITSSTASSHQAMEAETSEETSPSMLQRIHELQDERKCKLCHNEEADNVLVPCGHLCICTSCTSKTSKCPLCRRKFDKAIRTYIT